MGPLIQRSSPEPRISFPNCPNYERQLGPQTRSAAMLFTVVDMKAPPKGSPIFVGELISIKNLSQQVILSHRLKSRASNPGAIGRVTFCAEIDPFPPCRF